jgi:radical SAM superfamily enzyme YgiQ (UPF0313 family)
VKQSPLIVLSADRTLTAGYSLLFEGMVAASQTTTTPLPLVGPLLLPRNRGNAPLGLRRIEGALLAGGFGAGEVAVAPPERLLAAVGPETRLIGLSAGEPGGRGMNSSTMTAIAGGRIWPQRAFEQLLERVRRAKRQAHPAVRILFGGSGAWQLEQDAALQQRLGIDHVVTGYAEGSIAEIARELMADPTRVPRVIKGGWRAETPIPPIAGPTTFGAVEISRGCGLGCAFCTIARTPMVHLPPELIAADVRTNLAGGQRSVSLLSEDLFRYGGDGRSANPQALVALLERLRTLEELRLLQVDHANIATVAQFSDAQLRRVRELLAGARQRYLWINIGVESPVGELLRLSGASAKMLGCELAAWGDMCRAQLLRLCEAGYLPLVSLIVGMPGQTPEHIRATTAWVESFGPRAITFFPVLYAPIDTSRPVVGSDLTREHWRLIRACYRYNFRWIPRMVWDSQAAAGVSLAKRLLLQGTGMGQVGLWNGLFLLRQWRAK